MYFVLVSMKPVTSFHGSSLSNQDLLVDPYPKLRCPGNLGICERHEGSLDKRAALLGHLNRDYVNISNVLPKA